MIDCVLIRVLFEKGSISVSNNTFLLLDKNRNYQSVYAFSDNTPIMHTIKFWTLSFL